MVEAKLQLLLFLVFAVNEASSFVALVGPRIVPQGKFYKALLTSSDYSEHEKVTILITATNGDQTDRKKIVLNTPKYVSLKLSKELQNYTLTMLLNDGNFNQSVEIFIIPKRYSVFIQTDKAMYKPGDIVQFRVLVVDHEMKPYQFKTLRVEIKNPLDDSVREINKTREQLQSDSGVLVDQFRTSEYSALDDWKIQVTVDGEADQALDQKFEVKEYVLPRFEVIVETKPFVRATDGSLHLTVSGRYTFGKFVKGNVTVQAKLFDPKYKDKVQHHFSKTANVDSVTTISFDIENDLQITNSIRPYEVRLRVTFEEILTTQQINKTVSVRVYSSEKIEMKLEKEEKFFKPGFPFRVRAIIKNDEKKLVATSTAPVTFQVIFKFTKLKCASSEDHHKLKLERNFDVFLKNGFADLDLPEIPLNTTEISVSATFFEATETIIIGRFLSNSREYIKIQEPKHLLKIDSTVEMEVHAIQENFNEITVVVIGRSGIVHDQKVQFEDDEFSLTFSLTLTKEMAPSSHLLVYYIQPSGEIIYDQIKLNMEHLPVGNNLKIALPETALPGQKTKIKIISKADSHVFLLGVDKSVKLLKSGNDIDKDRIIAQMLPHTNKNNFPKLKTFKSRYLDFEDANAVILTDAVNGTNECSIQKIDDDDDEVPYESEEGGDKDTLTETTSEKNDDDIADVDYEDDNFDLGTQSKVRKNFKETWVFRDFKMGTNGKKALLIKLPDTISTFVLTGFSIHPELGLTIADPNEILVTKEFFINLYLPYSIQLGEVLKVDVIVFNNNSNTRHDRVNANVTLYNLKGEFEFVKAKQSGQNCIFEPLNVQEQTELVEIHRLHDASTFFLIRALKTGNMTLKLKALANGQEDEIENILLVENEGVTVTKNVPFLIDLRNKTNENVDKTLAIPTITFENSVYIESLVVGDLLGPALENVDNLINMPSGCTEQTFKKWIPNIAAVKYLTSIGQLTKLKEVEANKYLTEGYEICVRRQNDDGSFSFWSKTTDKSVWLTAYVVKLLKHAKNFIAIDDSKIVKAIKWIKGKQKSDGTFDDSMGKYYQTETSSHAGIPVTAFIVIAFLEKGSRPDDKAFINECLTYIDSNVFKLNDPLSFAISAYAFALNKHPSTNKSLEALLHCAIRNDEEMFWHHKSASQSKSKNPSVEIEIAAYAIMALMTANRAIEAAPIVKWLIKQQNPKGGFYSTTDTVLAIQALSLIGSTFYTPNVTMQIQLEYGQNRKKVFSINSANAMEIQHKKLEANTRSFSIKANGNGLAWFQVSYRYDTLVLDPKHRYDLTVERLPSSTESLLNLKICIRFIANKSVKSGMTLMEVQLPSGYVYDQATAEKVKAVGVRKTETQKRKTLVVLYFDSVGTTSVCPEIVAFRQNIVADSKKTLVKVYDYYNQDCRSSVSYSVTKGNICELAKLMG